MQNDGDDLKRCLPIAIYRPARNKKYTVEVLQRKDFILATMVFKEHNRSEALLQKINAKRRTKFSATFFCSRGRRFNANAQREIPLAFP